MKVLVIGRGGREHAVVKKLARDSKVTEIFCAPGNDGMIEATLVPIEETDVNALAIFAKENRKEGSSMLTMLEFFFVYSTIKN
jgi:phosphoribosylamine--glycine ligase